MPPYALSMRLILWKIENINVKNVYLPLSMTQADIPQRDVTITTSCIK